MRIGLVDKLSVSGVELTDIVSYLGEGKYLTRNYYEFFILGKDGIMARFGRRNNQVNLTLEETMQRVKQQHGERIEDCEEGITYYGMVSGDLEEKIDALRYYFEHGDPFERIEYAKVAEDGRLYVVYGGHQIPEDMQFYFGRGCIFQYFYDESDRAYDNDGNPNLRFRLEPERTRTLRVFEGDREVMTLKTDDLKKRKIYGIQDISISPDGRIYVAYYDDQYLFSIHDFRDPKYGAVRILSPDFGFIGSFGNRPQDFKVYGGIKRPYFVGAVGENIMVADDYNSRIRIFTRNGTLVDSCEFDGQNLSIEKVFFGDAYVGISGNFREEIPRVYMERCFPQFWKKRAVQWTSWYDFAIAQVYGHDFSVKTGLRIPDNHALGRSEEHT
ncbi:MAG: hypothetical protein EPN86_00205, partial [Nanoarchaeota archaeon]